MKRKSGGLLYGANVKRRKVPQLQLWDLPVGISCNIISRLPIRDAIRTSILSSQCQYLWCGHSNLTFNCYTLRRGKSPYGCRMIDAQDFISRVDAVLQQHSGIGVNVMEVRCALRNMHADRIDRWVKFAIVSRTKELRLHLSDLHVPVNRAEAYNFPCHLFSASNGSHMRCLQVTSVSLDLPLDISGFLNLKRLNIVDVNITEEHFQYLLSKCNLLEFLEIAYCRTLTSIRALHPMDQLKHLEVKECIMLQGIQMNCGLTTLEYTGPVVPLEFATISRLRNVSINLLPFYTVLDYITTGFPSTLPHLETFNLQCVEHKRSIFPLRPANKFIYLRHLRLEAIVFDNKHRNTDVLDYAYLLNVAPFMEKLELHMWMKWHHQPYHAEHGELRSLPSQSHQHTHLRWVDFTGFFGHKDQVELALHILHSTAVLESMRIDPRVTIIPGGPYAIPETYKWHNYVDGCMVATEFVRKADHNNVIEVVGAPPKMTPEAAQTAT